jgi:hypothetical protein
MLELKLIGVTRYEAHAPQWLDVEVAARDGAGILKSFAVRLKGRDR